MTRTSINLVIIPPISPSYPGSSPWPCARRRPRSRRCSRRWPTPSSRRRRRSWRRRRSRLSSSSKSSNSCNNSNWPLLPTQVLPFFYYVQGDPSACGLCWVWIQYGGSSDSTSTQPRSSSRCNTLCTWQLICCRNKTMADLNALKRSSQRFGSHHSIVYLFVND